MMAAMPHRSATLGTATDAKPRAALAEQVYAQIKAELHDFLWVPGDRFSETDIGARLGVSRTPVREALFRLRNEGFLDVESKAGWFVKPIDFDRLDQLYDLRIVLETASLDRLAHRADEPGELQALKAVWLVPDDQRLTDGHAVGELEPRNGKAPTSVRRWPAGRITRDENRRQGNDTDAGVSSDSTGTCKTRYGFSSSHAAGKR